MARYDVLFKAFKTGSWYKKTTTDSVAAACSVADTCNWGRAYQVIDTITKQIIKQKIEDASMKSCNGYPRSNMF